MKSKIYLIVVMIIVIIVFLIFINKEWIIWAYKNHRNIDFKTIIIGTIIFVLYALLKGSETKVEKVSVEAYEISRAETEKLQETIEEDFFTNLVKINFKYLDQYYFQTQIQAEKSFELAKLSSIIGFAVVILGIIMMIFDKAISSYIVIGAGLISEFISVVFFYLYNKTILKMSHYHKKLLISQNISTALKLTEDMKEELKKDTVTLIIDRLTLNVNDLLAKDEGK